MGLNLEVRANGQLLFRAWTNDDLKLPEETIFRITNIDLAGQNDLFYMENSLFLASDYENFVKKTGTIPANSFQITVLLDSSDVTLASDECIIDVRGGAIFDLELIAPGDLFQ